MGSSGAGAPVGEAHGRIRSRAARACRRPETRGHPRNRRYHGRSALDPDQPPARVVHHRPDLLGAPARRLQSTVQMSDARVLGRRRHPAVPPRRPWRGRRRWRRTDAILWPICRSRVTERCDDHSPTLSIMPLIGQEAAGSQNACWQAGSRSPAGAPSHMTLLPRFADIPWYLAQNGGTAMAGLLFGVLAVETRRPECLLGMVGIVVMLSLVAVLSSTHSAQPCSKVRFGLVFGRKLIVACSCLAVGALLAAARLASSNERRPQPARQISVAFLLPQQWQSPAPLRCSLRHWPTAVCVAARQSNSPRTI